MLVYDITEEQSFANVTKWLRNIEEVSVILTIYIIILLLFFKVLKIIPRIPSSMSVCLVLHM